MSAYMAFAKNNSDNNDNNNNANNNHNNHNNHNNNDNKNNDNKTTSAGNSKKYNNDNDSSNNDNADDITPYQVSVGLGARASGQIQILEAWHHVCNTLHAGLCSRCVSTGFRKARQFQISENSPCQSRPKHEPTFNACVMPRQPATQILRAASPAEAHSENLFLKTPAFHSHQAPLLRDQLHIYIHTHICIYVCICIYIHIHTYVHAYIHTYIHTHIHTYIHTYTYTRIYICIRFPGTVTLPTPTGELTSLHACASSCAAPQC